MVSEALLNLCKNALKFDPARSNNPFAFYTTAIHNSFLQYMSGEKREHYIRDMLLLDEGEETSAGFEDNIIKKKVDESKERKANKKKAKDNLLDY